MDQIPGLGPPLQDQDFNSEQHEELDAVSHETLDLVNSVVDKTKDLGQRLVNKEDKITESAVLGEELGSVAGRLPADVLFEIFNYYLIDSDHLSRRSDPSPILLASVCRRWRDTAFDMAKLWGKLSFYVDHSSKKWKRSALYYDAWLQRSRDCPLSLQLRPGYAKGGTAKLRRLIQPYMSRVSSLDIIFWNDVEPKNLLSDLPETLQKLTVNFADCFDAPETAHSLSELPSTVRSLKIRDRIFSPDCLYSLYPVWAHLTHVEIAIRPRSVLNFLFLCPKLSSCELILDQPASMRFQVHCARHPHANLQSLCIICPENFYFDPLPALFNAFTLPKLRTLEIRYAFLSSPHQELRGFLKRSKCPLEILIFDAVVTPPLDQQGDLIAIIPSLKIECRLHTEAYEEVDV
ncbi:hypothetical protein CY34DRAFT_801609 [Suillus luteus UH-Slu-Lm8-n1]|uniref:F-box domain-containing protein n=1 Tax=Suillus luteus UH-Slu-Lm8-n1 TaxID=930992 RepID=A0A0D0BH15_9AGAM|nr:hypothetical protein CY34DRAFT_801609 [Suillus luteus UH-Slu-Lm8-n1]